jgi:predicted ATPase
MWAYLLLLCDPIPHPLLCIEEPENQLYPQLLYELAEEFRGYAELGGQVFVSTHSPDFLNGMKIDEIVWLKKEHGFSVAVRAAEQKELVLLSQEGDLPGQLWSQKFFEGANL